MKRASSLIALALLFSPALAHANDDVSVTDLDIESVVRSVLQDEGFLRKAIGGTLARKRRGVSLGPSLAVAGVKPYGGSDYDLDYEFGIQFLSFEVPSLLSPAHVKEVALERVKQELKEAIADALLEGRSHPDRLALRTMARQIIKDVILDLVREREGKTFETPGVGLRLTGHYNGANDVGLARIAASQGVKGSFVTLGIGGQYGSAIGLALSAEISLPALPMDSYRSPVIEPFARYEFIFSSEPQEERDLIVVGLRLGLDII